MKQINILASLSLALPLLSFAGGTDISGGGESVREENKIALRDLYDKTVCHWEKGESFLKRIPRWAQIIQSIKTSSTDLSFSADLIDTDFKLLDICETNSPLVKIPTEDDGALTIYTGSNRSQIAIRLNREIYLDMTQFQQMDDTNKAYLLLHETLHTFIPKDAERRNSKLRSLVKAIRDNELDPMDASTFKLQFVKASFDTYAAYKDRLFWLRLARMNAKTLLDHYSAKDLKRGSFTAKELKEAGVSSNDLLDLRYEIDDLVNAGLTATDIVNRFSTEQLLQFFTITQLKEAGYKVQSLARYTTIAELRAAGYSLTELASAYYDYHFCYDPQELISAGFQRVEVIKATRSRSSETYAAAIDLKIAGFTTKELKPYFGLAELFKAHFSMCDLNTAYTKKEIRKELRRQFYPVERLEYLGYLRKCHK